MDVRLNASYEQVYRSQKVCVCEPKCNGLLFMLWYVVSPLTILDTSVFSHYEQVYRNQEVCVSGPMFIGLFFSCAALAREVWTTQQRWRACYCCYRCRHRFWHLSLIIWPSQWATVLTVDSQPTLTCWSKKRKHNYKKKASSRNAICRITFMNYVMKEYTNLNYMSRWAGVLFQRLN